MSSVCGGNQVMSTKTSVSTTHFSSDKYTVYYVYIMEMCVLYIVYNCLLFIVYCANVYIV